MNSVLEDLDLRDLEYFRVRLMGWMRKTVGLRDDIY